MGQGEGEVCKRTDVDEPTPLQRDRFGWMVDPTSMRGARTLDLQAVTPIGWLSCDDGSMGGTGLRPFEDAVNEVVSVDILRLVERYDDDRATLADRGLVGAMLAHRTGEEATVVAKMVAALPPGEQMRCHFPRYGVVFELGSGDSLSAAICFECNNARTFEGSVEGWFTFDGGSTAAVRLLTLLRTMDDGSAHVA